MYTDYTEEENNDYSDYYSDDNDDKSGNGNSDNKEKIKKLAIFILAFVVLVVIIILIAKGCSSRKNPVANADNGNQLPSVALSRESYSIEVSEEVEIYADVLMADIDTPVVGWQTEDSNIAKVEDLGDRKALITGVSEGKTNIVAMYRENGRLYSNKCLITVTSKAITVEKINIVQENITMAKGKELLLQIEVTPPDAKLTDITFESSDPSVAVVSSEGKLSSVGIGTATITAIADDGRLTDTMLVTVAETGKTTIDATGVVLRGLSNGLKVGGTATVINDVLPSNATNKVLTWSSTNPSVATVNSEGVVTGISAGTTTIVASTSNGVSGKLEITVESDTVPVSSVMINDGPSISMVVHGTKLLTYTISPSNATNQKVFFTSSNRSVATVDSNGIIGGRSAGTTIITITTEDGRKTASITVTVTGSDIVPGTQTGSSSGDNSSGGSSSSGGYESGSSSGYGSGSSSGNVGGSSGSLVGSPSTPSDVACSDSMMTYITHNGSSKGAIISQYSFSAAKAFTGMTEKPKITISSVSDCMDRISYKVYYGTLESNVTTNAGSGSGVKAGSTITLNNGDGYYKIVLTGYLKNTTGVDFTKTYYAIVKNGSTSSDTTLPYVSSITAKKTSTTAISITTKISETGSGLRLVKYCFATVTSGNPPCNPSGNLATYSSLTKGSALTVSRTISLTNASPYKKACIQAIDGAGNTSTIKCVDIN